MFSVLFNTKCIGSFRVQCLNYVWPSGDRRPYVICAFLERYGLPPKKWCWLFEAPNFRRNQYVVAYQRKNGMSRRKDMLKSAIYEHRFPLTYKTFAFVHKEMEGGLPNNIFHLLWFTQIEQMFTDM